MAKKYHVLVPYCCSVIVTVTVDEEISTADAAMDAAMNELDSHDASLQFIGPDNFEVNMDKVDIVNGEFVKQVISGAVLHVPCSEISWEEADG